jgi:polyisoprenyl-teichoic acid--peptidoglycan teichoic acid transferase
LRSERKRTKKRKWLKITFITLSVILLLVVGYLFMLYKSLTNTVANMHEPVRDGQISEKRDQEINFKNKDPFSILLLGVDQRAGDKGRSDTIIVMTVNPKKQSIEMVSIPRDTRTEIIGRGFEDKINHAYAFGGVEMSINTIENFLDIPIDYFVQVNMEGFKEIVDAVGGVTVDNDLEFSYDGHSFPKGKITLNGEEALAYSRMRKADPRGDFGRQIRQRQIIEGVIKEGASLETLVNYGTIFEALSDNVKTNLTFDQMVAVQANYRAAAKSINQHQVNGSGKRINGIYYYIVPEEEKLTIQNLLKDHLELK